jgi:hypothetical protein
MKTVPSFPRGVQLVTTTPKEQVRASIAMTHCFAIAERLLQADKACPSFKLSDLRDDNERGIYVDAAASFLLDQVGRTERAELLNQTRAHGFATADAEQEDVMRQARRDIHTFANPMVQAFLRTNPRFCPLCLDPLISNRVDVQITEAIKGTAHGLCCAKDEQHFEFIHENLYRLIGGGDGR